MVACRKPVFQIDGAILEVAPLDCLSELVHRDRAPCRIQSWVHCQDAAQFGETDCLRQRDRFVQMRINGYGASDDRVEALLVFLDGPLNIPEVTCHLGEHILDFEGE